LTKCQVVTLSTKGQLVLPRVIRDSAGLHPGSELSISLEPDGSITIRPVKGRIEAFFHSLDSFSVPAPGDADIDAAIMEAVKDLDDATHQR
jgi:AbrB family looped-hinge helix DNA binding protein